MLLPGVIRNICIRLEIRTYNPATGLWELDKNKDTKNDIIIKQSDIDPSSSISLNSGQNISRNLSLIVRNIEDPITRKGLQNWGADFNSNKPKWWLDRRLSVYVRVYLNNDLKRRANKEDFLEMPMGVFVITGMSSSGSFESYPVTTIQGASGEALFASRRGKFDNNVTIEKGTSIIDAIKRILISGGEKPENILISPNVYSSENDDLEDITKTQQNMAGSNISVINELYNRKMIPIDADPSKFTDMAPTWNGGVVGLTPVTKIEEDKTSFRTKYSSCRIRFENLSTFDKYFNTHPTLPLLSYNFVTIFGSTLDLSKYNSIGLYVRSDIDLQEGVFQLWFHNQGSTIPIIANIGELVGNIQRYKVTQLKNGSQMAMTEQQENWRQLIVPLGLVSKLNAIESMELRYVKPVGTLGSTYFHLWIDDIIVSNIQKLTPNPLNYTISQNKWIAINDLANLIECDAYYTRDGYFVLDKEHVLDPDTYIRNIREYLLAYFGTYTSMRNANGDYTNPSDPISISTADFMLTETDEANLFYPNSFTFEPFYKFTEWCDGMWENLRIKASYILKISTNNLYNYNLLQPNTYSGEFLIYLDNILDNTRKQKIIDHCLDPANFENIFTRIVLNNQDILRADLIELLYFNTTHQQPGVITGNMLNYYRLDQLFDKSSGFLQNNDEYSGVFHIRKDGNYQVPQEDSSILFTDLTEDWRTDRDKRFTLYGGGNYDFDEAELANHIITYGGSVQDPISGKAEGKLMDNGLLLRVKGKFINERGRIRGINQMDSQPWHDQMIYTPLEIPKMWLVDSFFNRATYVKALDENTQDYEYFRCLHEHWSNMANNPVVEYENLFNALRAKYGTIWTKQQQNDMLNEWSGQTPPKINWIKETPGYLLNQETDLDLLYKGCFNVDTIKRILASERFKPLVEQPITNFSIERIGDYIYHHNNGSPDPLLKYTWELMNRVIYEFREKLSFNQKFSLQSLPYYGIDVYQIVTVHDRHKDVINKRFKVDTVNIPLNGNYMNVTLSSEYRPNVGIPSFDQSHKYRYGPYFYGIDVLPNNEKPWEFSVEAIGYGEVLPYDYSSPEYRGYNVGSLPIDINDRGVQGTNFTYQWSRQLSTTHSQLSNVKVDLSTNPGIATFAGLSVSVKHYFIKNSYYVSLMDIASLFGAFVVDGINGNTTTVNFRGRSFTFQVNESDYIFNSRVFTMSDGHSLQFIGGSGYVPIQYAIEAMFDIQTSSITNTLFNYEVIDLETTSASYYSHSKRLGYDIRDVIRHSEPSHVPNRPKNDEEHLCSADILEDHANYDVPLEYTEHVHRHKHRHWKPGDPIGMSYDFYDISFFESEMSLETGYLYKPITNSEADFVFVDVNTRPVVASKSTAYTLDKNGNIQYL